MKAILIDVTAMEVRNVEYETLEEMRALIGGWIETAYVWPRTLDVLYVDEGGLLKDSTKFFHFERRRGQMLVGNGLIVGRERLDTWKTHDPMITAEQVRELVTFVREMRQTGTL